MNTITIAFLLSLLANIHLVHAMEMGNKKKSMALQQVSAPIIPRRNRILDIQHAKKDDNNVQYKVFINDFSTYYIVETIDGIPQFQLYFDKIPIQLDKEPVDASKIFQKIAKKYGETMKTINN